MKLTDFIKTLIELKEYDPDVEVVICDDDGETVGHISHVTLYDGTATIYADVDGEEE